MILRHGADRIGLSAPSSLVLFFGGIAVVIVGAALFVLSDRTTCPAPVAGYVRGNRTKTSAPIFKGTRRSLTSCGQSSTCTTLSRDLAPHLSFGRLVGLCFPIKGSVRLQLALVDQHRQPGIDHLAALEEHRVVARQKRKLLRPDAEFRAGARREPPQSPDLGSPRQGRHASAG